MTTSSDDIFNQTQWTIVLDAAEANNEDAATKALGYLCNTYWYPLYVYARHCGKSLEESEDVVQSFFEKILSNPQIFKNVDRKKGKFRAYLIASFKSFMYEEYRRNNTLKKGGQTQKLELDSMNAEERYQTEYAITIEDKDFAYDQVWANEILQKVMANIAGEYERRNQLEQFNILKNTILSQNCDYDKYANLLNVSNNTVRVIISRFRRRWQENLYKEVAQTIGTNNKEDIEDEIHYLINCLS